MKRQLRNGCRNITRLNDAARMLDKAINRIGVPDARKEEFLDWTLTSLWNAFNESRMNQRIALENEINNLGLKLPNGTVNKEYTAVLDLPGNKVDIIGLDGADRLGLSVEVAANGRCTLHGTPTQPGDYTLSLRYLTTPGEQPSELTIPVAFNPDPRALWLNIPTDTNIPYYKPDSDTAYIKVEAGADGLPRKDIVAASQRGRSHAQEGKARDDHFRLHHCDQSDWYIIAVADGAGSAKYSRKGSEVACNTVVDHCLALLQHNPDFESAVQEYAADRANTDKRTAVTRHVIDIVYKGAQKAHDAVKRAAEANPEAKLRDFSTTLMFAVCKRYHFGWFIASFWVGDGAMCLYNATNHTAKLLGTPDEGEYSGQTRFLTMSEIFHDPDVVTKRLRMAIVPDFTALFLMSDGVSDPMFETDKNLNDYSKWEELYNTLTLGFPEDGIGGVDLSDDNDAAKDQLLRWLDFWSPGNHDDRTIAILY